MIQPPIEVILFDLGNVILPFNHYQIAEKLYQFTRNKEFQDSQKIFSFLFDLQKGAINDMDIGKVSPLDFFQSIQKTLDLAIPFEQFIPLWSDIFVEDQRVSEMILALKRRGRLGLLSNTDPLHFNYILSKFPIIQIFDKWILSYDVGFKKPAVEIFQAALKWASVEPKKIIFIDDIKEYVEVAISLGMHGIHFISSDQLKAELNKKL